MGRVPRYVSFPVALAEVSSLMCCYAAGDDNSSDLCIVGDVSNIFEGNLDDHEGPYAGISMGC